MVKRKPVSFGLFRKLRRPIMDQLDNLLYSEIWIKFREEDFYEDSLYDYLYHEISEMV